MLTQKQIQRKARKAARRKARRQQKTGGQPPGGILVAEVIRRNPKQAKKYRAGMKSEMASPLYAHLSECALKFAAARTDPWCECARGACIPDMEVLASQKLRFRARGFMSTGGTGVGNLSQVGWIVVDPWLMVSNDNTTANFTSGHPIIYTNNQYAGTSFSWADPAGAYSTGVVGVNSDSTYPTSFWKPVAGPDVPEAPTFRVVGCGIRIRYTGAAINRGGRITAYRSPNNTEINHSGVLSSASFLKTKESITDIVSTDWHHVNYVPTAIGQFSYQTLFVYGNGNPVTDINTSGRCILLYIDAPSTTPVQFEYDVVCHVEAMGPGFQTTASHSDPVGFGAVQTALTETPIATVDSGSDFSTTVSTAIRHIGDSVSGIAYGAGRMAGRAAVASLAGMVGGVFGPVGAAVATASLPGPVVTEV